MCDMIVVIKENKADEATSVDFLRPKIRDGKKITNVNEREINKDL